MTINHDLKLLKDYKEKGFVSPIELYKKTEISNFRLQFNKLENRIGKEKCQMGIANMHLDESFIWELATDSRLLDLIRILLGNNFKMLSTHFFCKYPGKKTKSYVAWHQDVTYW